MSQYFDKTFFKFLLGFVALVTISCTLVIGARLYETSQNVQTAAAAEAH